MAGKGGTLQHQHQLWVPVCVSAILPLIQCPINGLEEAEQDAPSVWVPITHRRDLEFLASA